MSPRPEPFALDLGGGERIVGDWLPGQRPGYLFLHGMASVRRGQKSESLFAHAAAAGRACLRIDQRGHGESTGKLGFTTVGELIADCVRLLEGLGPTFVVGTSLGGLVAAHAAVRRPELFAGLFLVAPAFGFLANLPQRLDARGRMWTSEGQGFTVDPRVLADAAGLDEAGLPARLGVPTLLAHGTADAVVPHRQSERFFAAVAAPHKELLLVPGGDHRLADVAPQLWPRFDAFLRAAARLPASPP